MFRARFRSALPVGIPALLLILGGALLTRPGGGAVASPPPPDVRPAPARAVPVASWLVTLDGPSVYRRYASLESLDASGAAGRDAAATVARAKELAPELAAIERAVQEVQAPVLDAITASGAQVISRYTTAANGALIHATVAEAMAVGALPGVTRIELAPIVRPMLGQSVPHIGATALAAELGFDGSDSYVAVIDTGVDYTHGHLGGPGTVEAFQAAAAQREVITDTWEGKPLYPNAKVVAGWDFVGRRYNPPHICTDVMMAAGTCTNVPEPDADPLDGASHGTHVSGIVAGNAVANLADGVAPGAKLVGLKLYGLGGADEAADVLVDALEWLARVNLGLEDRGVLPPRVDAVNISLGEGQAIASHLFDEAAEAAVGAGVIVAASAGNSGNRPYVLGSPSASPSILSVASSVPPSEGLEILTQWADAGGDQEEGLLAIESSIARPLGETGVITAPLAWFGRACADDAQEQDVTERIALVERGTCTFSEKLLNAQTAGAIAVLMFTDGRGKNAMGGDGAGVVIPAVMIDNAPGIALRDRVTNDVAVTVLIDPSRRTVDDSSADAISGFSSRGPSRNGALKPDITGPGSGILSAARGSGTGGSSSSGTSMSSPHLAGAAGVVQQRNREQELGLGAADLGALLMNYARPVIDGGASPVVRQGAGRVDMMGAGTGMLLVRAGEIASLNIGALAVTTGEERELSLQLRNLGTDTELNVALRSVLVDEGDLDTGITVGLPDAAITVQPGEQVQVSVPVAIDPETMRPWRLLGSAGANAADVQLHEIDGYIIATLVDSSGTAVPDAPEVSVPFYGLPRRASALQASDLRPQADDAGEIALVNTSAYTGTAEIFLLPYEGSLASDEYPDAAADDPDEPEVGLELDLRTIGVRFEPPVDEDSEGRLAFGVALHEVAAIPQQASTHIFVDTDLDGAPDYRIREVTAGDAISTRYAAWDVVSNTIAGTELLTKSLHVTDLHTRVSVLSVPLSAVGLDGPAPIAFSVRREGNHEDWRHIGLPDWAPNAAAAADEPWPHYTLPLDRLSRMPARWTAVLPGGSRTAVPMKAGAQKGDLDPELLVLYPSNDFAPAGGTNGSQIQRLRATPASIILPLLMRDHVLGGTSVEP